MYSNIIKFREIYCPVLNSWKDSEWGDFHHEVLYKDQIITLFESSIGLGKVNFDKYCDYYFYEVNGKRHRDFGPAVIYYDGTHIWKKHGLRNRLNGPAYYEEYWIKGVFYKKI